MSPDPTQTPPEVLAEEVIDYESLVIKDDTPVDNIFVGHLYRLLTEPLYAGWAGPGEGRSYLALSNVGLFYQIDKPPLVPDMMLSLDVPADFDPHRNEKNSYYLWRFGKPPE